MSPTIFNVVVDAVVYDWESLVAEREGGESRNADGDMAQTSGRKIQERDNGRQRAEEEHTRLTVKAAFFYADNSLVYSIDLGWIKLVFDMLTGLFDQVGLRKNV